MVSLDGVAPSRMVGVFASVNLHKVQKFSSGTGSPGCSRKKGRKIVVCGVVVLQAFWMLDQQRQNMMDTTSLRQASQQVSSRPVANTVKLGIEQVQACTR